MKKKEDSDSSLLNDGKNHGKTNLIINNGGLEVHILNIYLEEMIFNKDNKDDFNLEIIH